jgi:diguanylate cyclase (GGDEF)-like protein
LIREIRKTRRFLLDAGLVVVVCMALGVQAAVLARLPDFRAVLDEAQEISSSEHWHEAEAMLDELRPFIDQAGLREFADYQLLRARHLALDDRSEESLTLAESLLDLDLPADLRVRVLQFRANISVLLRRYEPAFESLGEALRIELDDADRGPEIETLNMAAYMLGRVGEYDLGIEYGERALAIAHEAGQPQDACVALQRLAPVYKWAEQAGKSETAYREGIRVCREVDNALFVGVLQHGLADLLRRAGQAATALPLVEESVAALQQAAYRLGEFEARLVRVETLKDLGRLDDTWRDELTSLDEFFAERSLWDQSARLKRLQSDLAADSGDHELALERLRDFIEAREQFLGRERAMRLAYLQVEFNSRFQRQQIDLLSETARAAQLEARTAAQERRLRTFSWLLLGLVVLALVGLLFRAFVSRRRFRDLSRHDGLSGLANHTWFFEHGQTMIDRFRTESGAGRQIVLIVADIDHFKQINDRHGHRVGDQVIRRTARRLREAFSDDAMIGRIGGEEFAILLRVDRLDDAIAAIERSRGSHAGGMRKDDPSITISFGVSCARPDDDIETLRARADRALYQAKKDGRDRYVIDPGCVGQAR